ncbi:MAG TPA: DUF599 family protein [Aestuariivirga sp.]
MNFSFYLPPDFNAPHMFALLMIFVVWWLYEPLLNLLGRGTLNAQLHVVRLKWMLMLIHSRRENRTFDGILLGQISSAMSYFGSATLIILIGFVGALASINHIHSSMMEIAFVPPISLELFTVYFAAITSIVAHCFFSFTYGLRKLAYTLAMIGGLDDAPADTPQAAVMTAQTATVLTEAVKSLNSGIRGYFFAVAGFMLFAGPTISVICTLAIGFLLYYRQGLSKEALAIDRYVKAMREEG